MIEKIINLKKVGIAGFVIVMLAGCVKDTTNTTYNGPDLVEFANPNYIAPVNPISRTVATTATPKNDSMYIQLVGAQRNTATAVTYSVDPASTAVSGTDYNFNTASPVEIAANTSGVKVRVVINKVTTQKKLIINLTGGDKVTPSANFKTFTFTLNP